MKMTFYAIVRLSAQLQVCSLALDKGHTKYEILMVY